MADPTQKSPVSYDLPVRSLPAKGVTVTMEADPEQRSELARFHDLLSVERFSAEIVVQPWKSEGVRVTGRVEADIVQASVVTLEPVEAHIDEEISTVFVPSGSRLDRIEGESGEILVDPEGEDLPEVFEGESIDVGALAEEFFALGIDPYPRREGEALEVPGDGEPVSGPLQEALKKLKGKRGLE